MTSPDERQARAFEMRLAGATYEAIAHAVGYSNKGAAYQAVKAVLAKLTPNVDEERGLELARMDAMLVGLWPKARRGDAQSVDRVLKISERRAALLTIGSIALTDTENTETTTDAQAVTALDEFTRKLRDRESDTATARRTGSR